MYPVALKPGSIILVCKLKGFYYLLYSLLRFNSKNIKLQWKEQKNSMVENIKSILCFTAR